LILLSAMLAGIVGQVVLLLMCKNRDVINLSR
jgi:hypothetical protein